MDASKLCKLHNLLKKYKITCRPSSAMNIHSIIIFQLISFVRELGMLNTTYIDANGTYESLPDMSWPYVIKDGELVEFDMHQIRKVHMALGAGGILSTANDMAKYMNFHLNRGRVGDIQIVPEVSAF